MQLTMRRSGLLSVFILIFLCAVWAQDAASAGKPIAYAWKDAAIGSPPQAGNHVWTNDMLTVTGAGAGLNVKDNDQFQYVFITRKAGDFEVVARLTDITSDGDAVAGIMARTDESPNGAMTTLYYKPANNSINWMSRIPGASVQAAPRMFSAGIQLAQPKPAPEFTKSTKLGAPLWLRMVRMGKNFAVYKSRNGKLWSMISNVSGGPTALNGPIKLGLFVSMPGEQMATATFDSITIGPANMRYKSSWVGNTFGCRDEDNHVSNGLSAMWVAPDGTCYTSSYWDEAGQPVTSYRDGKVLRGLPIGTPQTAEGGITGDTGHLYLAANERITVLDRSVPDFAPRPLSLSLSMLDAKTNNSKISGMASNGRKLFVADAHDNLIRVATLEPMKTYYTVTAANNGVAFPPTPVIVPEDDARYAPALVYQTQHVGEGVTYSIPDLTPGEQYTMRGHFAEYKAKEPARRVMRVGTESINVFDLAGGLLKPVVKDFPGFKAGDNGIINIPLSGGLFGLCAFEILNARNERVFAINCGGEAVGDFRSETEELVSQAFLFERPGPMVVDKRGDLWIIQRGNDFPIGGKLTAKYPAAVKCYHNDGTFTGREITDVVNPRALGYDAAQDQLLVGENGPDLNVRFYAGLADAPALTSTFGEKGGIYAGKQPGLVYDPAAGGYARFAGISGVGVDALGNLYVGGGFQGSDLRMFTQKGKFGWMLNSLMFCNTYDVDPASDGAHLYGTYNHLKLNLAKTKPGTEQTYVGYNWDLRNYGDPVRAGGSQSIVRRLGAEKRLVMYSSGQGNIGDINIYRYTGELAIPAGSVCEGGSTVWIDTNGNGKMEDAEKTKMASSISWLTSLVVDGKGDIWATMTSTGGSFMRHFFFKGFNAAGVPLYSGVKGEGYVDVPYPEEGEKTSGWGMASRMDYDVTRDILVAFFPAVARTGEGDTTPSQYLMARYDNWSKGNRTSTWKVKAFRPETDPDYFMYETNLYPYSGYMGMQVAGDYIFFAFLFGEIHVFDLNTGQLVEILAHGPEVNGMSAWEDAAMGLRAFKRKNGEYLILTENSGWGGKNPLIRWKP